MTAAVGPAVPLIDSHVHLVDFLQDSEGIDVLLRHMDGAKVERAVVFGMPLIKKWEAFDPVEPHYYLDDEARCYYYAYTDQLVMEALDGLPPQQRDRFAPLICGFNPTDRHGVRHIERMMRRPGFWRGVGEVLLRHDDLTNLTLEETARANHPAMLPVYAFCEEYGLPILLHQNSSSVGRHDEYVYLHELEEVLSLHPRLTVVWGHCGLSRRVFHEHYHEMVDRMLSTYPRLNVDASWVGFDDEMCACGLVRPEWIALVERHADRFMIGSDLVGHFAGLEERLLRYSPLLQRLSDAARRRVAHGNAARIFFGEGEKDSAAPITSAPGSGSPAAPGQA